MLCDTIWFAEESNIIETRASKHASRARAPWLVKMFIKTWTMQDTQLTKVIHICWQHWDSSWMIKSQTHSYILYVVLDKDSIFKNEHHISKDCLARITILGRSTRDTDLQWTHLTEVKLAMRHILLCLISIVLWTISLHVRTTNFGCLWIWHALWLLGERMWQQINVARCHHVQDEPFLHFHYHS